ncbi:glycoside hydrolase family 3 protein [Actinomadura fibrosa]|uniref:Glycoside hydrolase family 3 N-terminal domain-containing protein n=1 Tax=Actinomadura fibrosa TaxID=111802 RepID=A0ABW2XKN7_9ACTN|nr:glycoside hydrolase family 3 protein [Actinomadura fibrosa]
MQVPFVRRTAARPVLSAALAVGLVLTAVFSARASTTDPEPGRLELANSALARRAASQGMVLLDNPGAALPMARSGNVALFGVGAYKTVKGGTGSGDVNNRSTVTARQGLENAGYRVTTGSAYWKAMTAAYDTKYPETDAGYSFGPAIDYSSVEQLLTADTVQPTAPTDTAIYVVARNSGEGFDRSPGAGDYQLTDTEKADIRLIGRTYVHVVIVLNVGGVIDTSFFKAINASAKDPSNGPALDSLLLMSQSGQQGGNALVDVLNGTVNPSGHLTDTWASKYSHYPASGTFGGNDGDTGTEPYREGIYVGYRYFDSFYKTIDPSNPASVVTYPFGWGLSYTGFRISAPSVRATAAKTTVKVRVTNTGARSGKEVVQVYFSAPQTGVDKAYQELAAFAKTDELPPGASQDLTISYDTTQMSSFDTARSAYVLDPGTYVIRVGDSSRSTHVAAKLTLSSRVTTESVDHELDGRTPDGELAGDPANFYTYAGEDREIAAAPSVALNPASFRKLFKDSRSSFEQDVPVPSTSPYYAIDKSPISSTTAYIDPRQTNWEGTGAPYPRKTGETLNKAAPIRGATLYDVAKGKMPLTQFVAGLSLDQLANIVEGSATPGSTPAAVGAGGYTTGKYENIGIPAMTLADGPAGLRITRRLPTTPPTYQWATAWPVGTLLAQTWDSDLVLRVGRAVGEEMLYYGATLWLAPGMNIHRDPLNGRNFEYYSEDPLLTGMTAVAATRGVQSKPGVGVTLKHLAGNNQEANRDGDDAVVSERALREIELKSFEYAVKTGRPMAVMSSYNKINGTWSSKNYDLLTDVLRGEWGFQGLVMTDWGGAHGATDTMYSGNDLIEPGTNPDEVVTASKKVLPTIDVAGLPAYTKYQVDLGGGRLYTLRYAWKNGSLVPSPSGSESVTTTVDSRTDLSKTPLSSASIQVLATGQTKTVANPPLHSVDEAYKAITAVLADGAVDTTTKASIAISNVVHAVPGDNASPVTAYTVTLKGDYQVNMRLGDLQRSARRILATIMQTQPFAQLAKLNHVRGITVHPYGNRFGKPQDIVEVDKNEIRGR